MKKAVLAIAVLVFCAFASCKKSYTCTCLTYFHNDSTFSAGYVDTTRTTIKETSKDAAKDACVNSATNTSYDSTSCSL